ncbi:putative RNA-dependent RNA polymerase [Fusarium graminearum dsRNA mycovirus 3]|uniref:RNA-directed RNA polymerase n=1 Tax=Fusarium graminearum dsRNA mycovirus 3 TaxID=687917 RepID=D0TZ30_9VIRU|nr:putative RNA-dependent RNA polymerase [Fusarium graminearum dsRNA mycovirus-3]ACY56323.1 putative RNA-dependent RNA polymerase [Fusarium graminearum dsRNA mycovirus-3]
MSSKTYLGFNFNVLYRDYSLHRVPENLQEAIVASVVLNPRPDALNLRVSPLDQLCGQNAPLQLGKTVLPGLGHAWLDAFHTAKKSRELELQRFSHTDHRFGSATYAYFSNFGDTKEASCATRLLQLLGLVYPFTDENHLSPGRPSGRPEDPYKLGVAFHQLVHACFTAFDPGFFTFAEMQYPFSTEDKTLATMDSLSSSFPRANILAVVYPDHVQYCVRRSMLETELGYYEMLTYGHSRGQPLVTKATAPKLIAAYPRNTGRAGGRIHLDLEDVFAVPLNNGTKALAATLERYRNSNDFESVFATTLLLLPTLESKATPDLILFFLRNAEYLLATEFTTLVKRLKAINQFIRIYQRIPGLGLPAYNINQLREFSDSLCGLDVLPGRSELLSLDFNAELLMRMADPAIRGVPVLEGHSLTFSSSLYNQYEDVAIKQSFDDLLPPVVQLEPFEQWYNRRMFWAASGGSPGSKITWNIQQAESKMRLNKRGGLLAIPAAHFRSILEEALRPIQWSVKALKYEPGKLRSILNTSMEHYIFQAYLLDHFDGAVSGGSWYASANAGFTKLTAHVERLQKLKCEVGLMWDFADFNINHTFDGMIKLFSALRDNLLKRSRSTGTPMYEEAVNDITTITKWVEAARSNTFISDNDAGNIAQVVRSLQSGERATSWINTLRNHVDHVIVQQASHNLFGYNVSPTQGYKTGDDVFLTVPSMQDALLTCAMYNLCGCAGQVSKIFVSYPELGGSRGEFVRYGYDAGSNSVRGYPLRALTGLVHGEYFNDPIISPADRCATILEQSKKLARRGIVVPKPIVSRLISKNCTLTYSEGNRKIRTTVPPELVELPAALGGVGVTQDLDARLVTASSSLDTLGLPEQRWAICIPSGEGKSTLAAKYPTLFIDHDSLLGPQFHELLRVATMSGQWRALNSYLKSIVPEDPRILLTWGPATIPSSRGILGAFLLARPSGIRANTANRKSIQDLATQGGLSKDKLIIAQNHAQRDRAILKLATQLLKPGSKLRKRFVDKDTGEVMRAPFFQFPRLPASEVMRRAKVQVVDYQSLHLYGAGSKIDQLDQSLLTSGLTGALPKSLLSNALAKQAKELQHYLNQGTFSYYVPPTLDDFHPQASIKAIAQQVRDQLRDYFAGVTARVAAPGHNYNSMIALLQPLGFSDGAGLQLAITSQKPVKYAGKLGQLWSVFHIAMKPRLVPAQQALRIDAYAATLQRFCNVNPATNEVHALIYQYLSGDLNLYPPSASHLSSELASVTRDLALMTFEARHLDTFVRGADYLRELISALDTCAQLALCQVLDEFAPNFIIRD